MGISGIRRRQALALLAGLTVALGLVGLAAPTATGATTPAPKVSPSSRAALAQDAPDPDVVRVGSTFYAFTTGTTWGNRIAIATSSSANPSTGWNAPGGSTAFLQAPPAAWQMKDTSTSPGVFQVGSTWVMFYDAKVATAGAAHGIYCLSVATASRITGPYTDSSKGPLECQTSLGGSIDPSPFTDPTTQRTYLLWKTNDGSSKAASQVWSAPLDAAGTGLAAAPTSIFTIHSGVYRWQTTTDDPSMVLAGGHYYLFFSGGDYLSNYYPVGYVLCSGGPRGGCDENEPADPILSGTGGTGGGMEFTDAAGRWWIAYQTWKPSGCTSYAKAGCERQLFVAPISLPAATVPSATNLHRTGVPGRRSPVAPRALAVPSTSTP